MAWPLALLLILGSVVFLMIMGMPVAFSFLLVNVVGVYLLWGGQAGLEQLISSIFDSTSSFNLLPLPLFILMGDVMFYSGVAPLMIEALDKWLGRLPGRLGLLAVGAGTVYATLSGSTMASTALLGSLLTPEMKKRGYKPEMYLGPILGSGGLAMLIPPSNFAVLYGAIAEVSIGKILVAITIPGLLVAVLYAAYIILRCYLQPSLAPPYEVPPIPILEKIVGTARYILPLALIIFLVLGIVWLGIATSTEAAAAGTFGCFILAAAYRRLNWEVVKKSFSSTIELTAMVLLIVCGATAFSQILSFTGASKGMVEFTLSLALSPIAVIIAMQIVLLFLGMIMSSIAIMMITIPIFMPVILNLGYDPVWFAVLFLVNTEMAQLTPPYGMNLYVMKGVAPPDTTMEEIIMASLPFCALDALAIGLIIAFPAIALWLPGLMR